jgi:hypothetical protein
VKCSSASATFPGGFPFSFGVILTVMVHSFAMMVAAARIGRLGDQVMTGHQDECRKAIAAAWR